MKHMLDHLVAHPEKGPARVRDGVPDDRAVLAVVRAPRGVRPGRRRPAPRRVAQLLAPGRARATGPASGTRPTWCARATTRRSTATCRRTGSARRGGSSRSPRPRAPAGDCARWRPDAVGRRSGRHAGRRRGRFDDLDASLRGAGGGRPVDGEDTGDERLGSRRAAGHEAGPALAPQGLADRLIRRPRPPARGRRGETERGEGWHVAQVGEARGRGARRDGRAGSPAPAGGRARQASDTTRRPRSPARRRDTGRGRRRRAASARPWARPSG